MTDKSNRTGQATYFSFLVQHFERLNSEQICQLNLTFPFEHELRAAYFSTTLFNDTQTNIIQIPYLSLSNPHSEQYS